MNYLEYFNLVCECVDKAVVLIKKGKDRGYALGSLLRSLCAADDTAHKLAVYYEAFGKADVAPEVREVLGEKIKECQGTLLRLRGYYFILEPRCESLEEMKRSSVIRDVLLNRAERAEHDADVEVENKGHTAYANRLYRVYNILDEYAEDIRVAMTGGNLEI